MGDSPRRSAFPQPLHARKGSPSQFPGGLVAGDALLALITGNVASSGRVYQSLLDRLVHVAVSDGVSRIYASLYDTQKCLTRGRGIATPPILSDAVAVFSVAVPVVLAAPLPGFGPMRMRFAIEKALAHHRAWLTVVHGLGQKASASAQKSTSVDKARAKRKVLKGLLSSATPATGPLRASLDGQVETGPRSAVEVVASIQTLQVASEALLHRGASDGDWSTVLDDMGISREVIDSLAGDADAVAHDSRAHRMSKGDLKQAWDELNTLDGITWFHLEEVVRACDRARVLGRNVPHVSLEAIEAVRQGRVKVTDEPEVTPAPAPAPDAPR